MADRPDRAGLPACPYPGIAPFSWAEREVFFARDDVARRLIRLIVLYRGVLLYSASGAGKSSLVNARVIPLALEEGYLPERLRVQPRQGAEIIVEPQPFPSFFSRAAGERMVLSVEALLAALEAVRGVAAAGTHHPLLIFDQFEEWVTLFEEAAGPAADEARACREKILAALAALIQDTSLPVKILLVLREDYLARLEPLFARCPTLPDHYVRLTALKKEQIERVIRGPFEKHPGAYPAEISPELAAELKTELAARADSEGTSPTEVQIVCRSLFEAGLAGRDPAAVFREQGGVQGLLERYLERSLGSLEPALHSPATSLLVCMITSAGTRNVISRDDLIERVFLEEGTAKELLGRALDELERETHLVRRELRREVYFYEIVSEFLVGWIGKRAAARRVEILRRSNRTLKKVIAALGIVLLVVLGLFAVWFWKEAERRRQLLYSQILQQSAGTVQDRNLRRGLLLALEAIDRAGPGRWRQPPLSWLPWGPPDAAERQAAAAAETALRRTLGRCKGFVPGSRERPVIRSVLSRDGRWLAGSGRGGTLQVWEVSTEGLDSEPAILSGSPQDLKVIAVSADRRWVAASPGTRQVLLWDRKDSRRGQPPVLLSARDPAISALEFSADGRWLLAAGREETPETWDLARLPAGSVRRACPVGITIHWALGPGARHLVVACDNSTAVLWDLGSPAPWAGRTLRGHESEISALAFSADEQALASGDLAGAVCVWRTAGDLGHRCERLNGGDKDKEVRALAFSPDGNRLAAGGQGSGIVWDSNLEHGIPLDGPGRVEGFVWGHTGDWLVARSTWAARDWAFLYCPSVTSSLQAPFLGAAAFGPGDRWIIVGDQRGTLSRWALEGPSPVPPPYSRFETTSGGTAIDRLSLTTDGEWVVSHDPEGQALIFKVGNVPELEPEPVGSLGRHQARVLKVAWQSTGRLLSLGADGALRVWKPDYGRRIEQVELRALTSPGQRDFTFSPDVRWIAACDPRTGTVRLWDLDARTGTEPRLLPIRAFGVAAISNEPVRLVTTGESPRLWDLSAAKPAPIELRNHQGGLQAATFSPDGHWLITVDTAGTARLWDLDRTYAMAKQGLPPEPVSLKVDEALTAAFSRDSRQIAVVGKESVLLGDVASGEAATTHSFSSGKAVAFSPDGRSLAVSTAAEGVSLWDLDTTSPEASAVELRGDPGGVTSLAFDDAGRWLFTGGEDGAIRRFRLDRDELLDLACRTAGRNLKQDETPDEWKQYLPGEPYRKTCPDFP